MDNYEERIKNQNIDDQESRRMLTSENSNQNPSQESTNTSGSDSRFETVMFYNDTITRPPEQFYKFSDVSRNTRTRLVRTNKDLFIIWG